MTLIKIMHQNKRNLHGVFMCRWAVHVRVFERRLRPAQGTPRAEPHV